MQKYSDQDVKMILRVLAELCYERISTDPDQLEERGSFMRQQQLYRCFQAMIAENGIQPPNEMNTVDFLQKFANIDFHVALNYIKSLSIGQKETLENFIGYVLKGFINKTPWGTISYLYTDDQRIAKMILQCIGKTNSILY